MKPTVTHVAHSVYFSVNVISSNSSFVIVPSIKARNSLETSRPVYLFIIVIVYILF